MNLENHERYLPIGTTEVFPRIELLNADPEKKGNDLLETS